MKPVVKEKTVDLDSLVRHGISLQPGSQLIFELEGPNPYGVLSILRLYGLDRICLIGGYSEDEIVEMVSAESAADIRDTIIAALDLDEDSEALFHIIRRDDEVSIEEADDEDEEGHAEADEGYTVGFEVTGRVHLHIPDAATMQDAVQKAEAFLTEIDFGALSDIDANVRYVESPDGARNDY